jgi:hypothetical protein
LPKAKRVPHAIPIHNFTEFAYGAPLPFGDLLKGAKITFGAVAKGYLSPF